MNIIINHTSMEPIYEQIVRQIRGQIIEGSLKENELLPSVRALSRELKISALTVKKAYDLLDEEREVLWRRPTGISLWKSVRRKWRKILRRRSAEEYPPDLPARRSGRCLCVSSAT